LALNRKKSQAAMEFLMTYGWAILVVIVVIAALAYFGVLDPSKFLMPSQCQLPAGLSCLDHRVYVQGVTNKLELNIKNNLGTAIQLTSIDISTFNNKHQDLLYITPLNNGDATKSPNNVVVSDLTNIAAGGSLVPSGTKYDFDFTITYTNQESQLLHTVNGHVKGKVN
jgi:hypothetical protein